MEYNPYAAPAAGPSAPHRGMHGGGGPQPWDIGEVLGAGWNAFKANWVVLVFSLFLGRLIPGLPGYFPAVLVLTGTLQQNTTEYWVVYGGCMVASILIGAFFQSGMIKIWLDAARGKDAQFSDLFAGGPHYFAMLGLNVLETLVLVIGFAIFIVPGVILALGLALAAFYVVDEDMGPIEAMKASWEATAGQKGALFLFSIVCFLLAIAGVMACCFGVFVTLPIAAVAMAIIYLRLSGNGSPPSGYGTPSPYAPPPAYGPPGY